MSESGIRRRALIAKKLLRLAGRDDIEVAAGVGGLAADPHNRAEGVHESLREEQVIC